MATIKVILWSVLLLAGVGYWRYAHAEPPPQHGVTTESAR